MQDKYLYFENSTSDIMLVPTSRLVEMEVNADDDVNLRFTGVQGVGQEMEIVLTVTSHKGKEVMASIADEIRFSKNPMIMVADETNSKFLHSAITAIETTLTDAALL